ncbi:hypothetical protein B1J94_06875 [Leptospira kirschneri serovar Grippotyphosa]|nr:hypothetical protein B1J94_06875 [Leptospira kirschneri serovar Grippotyphosa]
MALEVTQQNASRFRSRSKLKLKTIYSITFLLYNLLTGTKGRGLAKPDLPRFSSRIHVQF